MSEDRLWSRIRKGATGARFRRQVPITRWVADFASLHPKIVVEVDGPSHDDRDESERTTFLEDRGFLVVRFTNDQVRRHIDDVVEEIAHLVEGLRT